MKLHYYRWKKLKSKYLSITFLVSAIAGDTSWIRCKIFAVRAVGSAGRKTDTWVHGNHVRWSRLAEKWQRAGFPEAVLWVPSQCQPPVPSRPSRLARSKAEETRAQPLFWWRSWFGRGAILSRSVGPGVLCKHLSVLLLGPCRGFFHELSFLCHCLVSHLPFLII